MAIVRANYTKSKDAAKANIRYLQHRPGKDTGRTTRTLFGIDGAMGRHEAYRLIDEAQQGSAFFRFKISPDAQTEDTKRDLFLQQITEKTMNAVAAQTGTDVAWVAAVHDDHSAYRHVHVLAVVTGRLNAQDLQALRQTATEASCEQRRQRDQAAEQQGRAKAQREREGAAWDRER
jgi:hypothetical protein